MTSEHEISSVLLATRKVSCVKRVTSVQLAYERDGVMVVTVQES